MPELTPHPPPPAATPLAYDPGESGAKRWPVVDWFVPETALRTDPDVLRRMRLLVISIGIVVPFLLFAAVQLTVAGQQLDVQAALLVAAALVLAACPFILKATGSPVLPSVIFCVSFIGLQFYLAGTDTGLTDSALYWAAVVPLVGAFMAGPWLALLCAVLILGGTGGLYALEVGGYAFPHISSQSDVVWFTMLSIASATMFAAGLGWIYEGYTLKRLRRMNARLTGLQGALEESEARYRTLFENIPVGVYRSSPDGQIVMANEALVEMLGFDSHEAFLAFDLERVYAGPEGRAPFREAMTKHGEVNQFETALLRRDGQKVYVRENARAAFDERGTVLYYEGTVEDVTAHRRAKRALRASEERFRALVQHSSDTITVLDAAGIIQYQSPSLEQNLGYRPEDTVGKPILELVHPDDRRRAELLFRRVCHEPGEFGSVEFRVLHADGHYVYVEAVGTNMLDNPWVNGVVLNSRDVTERKRVEVALVQAKEQAEEVARMKSAFLANMSHEIRTPLTGILGFADVLAEEVHDEHREFVQLIERSGKRLLETLNSVLDLARIEADQMELDLDVVDVGEFVRDAVRLLGPLAEEKGLVLEAVVEAEGARARLDRGGFNRILNNLVGNAIKFTSGGGVTVRVSEGGERLRVAVQDTGVGIHPAFLPSLFEEFKQESTGLGRSHEGSGLGLTITRRLVEMMHGVIEVESEKGVGSTFTITFPRAGADAPPPALAAPELPAAAAADAPRLLVVDDNFSARLLLERMLRGTCTADAAGSAAEALALADETAYDLVLLDIHLSDVSSGVEVMRELRRRAAYRAVPIIAFTAFALPGDRDRFLNMGFDGYLGKPFTKQQLHAVLTDALGPGWSGADPLEAPSATFLES